jgi:GalNAc-alpha-(1->4)-GalNAc-alpha-(1->3)-diNAcBac-PP-undecaprenol alpha-1,4-N-acetyl-D-galactosaminyltransferase
MKGPDVQWRRSERVLIADSHKIAGHTLSNPGTVGLYFHRLGQAGGGAERMVCQLAGALVERGFRVHLVSWDAADTETFYPLHPDVQWTRLGFSGGLLDKLRRIYALARVLKNNGIQVMAGFVMSGDKTVYTAAKLANVRLLVAERNAPIMYRLRYNSAQRWLNFGFLHLADRIAVQMPSFVSGYPSSLRSRIEVIPNPVPLAQELAQPAMANAAGRFTLLSVSRLDNLQKRIDVLIRAFARVAVRHPAWDLRIIGDGPEETALHRLVEELGITDRVCIERPVAKIFEAYVRAHMFAIPSLWEGFPNALAEAMSHALPAVGFDQAAGVAELIVNGGGWLARGLVDEAAFASALDHAMGDALERTRRGNQAMRSMAAFAPQAQYDQWAALLKSLIAEHALWPNRSSPLA